MSTKFNMTRDINGYNGFGLPCTLDNWSCYLTAGANQSVTTPSNYPNWIAVLSYTPGSNIWVDCITTAVVPGSTFLKDTTMLNPSAIAVIAGQVLSFITSDITDPWVNVRFYVAPPFGN